MRKEASIQEWKDLYQAATIIKELKPWEHFWDMDLIGIQEGKEEDTVFFSVLGRGGGCVGYDPKSRYAGSGGGPKGSPGREYLEHICESAEIRLRRVKRLSGLDGFRKEMGRFTG